MKNNSKNSSQKEELVLSVTDEGGLIGFHVARELEGFWIDQHLKQFEEAVAYIAF